MRLTRCKQISYHHTKWMPYLIIFCRPYFFFFTSKIPHSALRSIFAAKWLFYQPFRSPNRVCVDIFYTENSQHANLFNSSFSFVSRFTVAWPMPKRTYSATAVVRAYRRNAIWQSLNDVLTNFLRVPLFSRPLTVLVTSSPPLLLYARLRIRRRTAVTTANFVS